MRKFSEEFILKLGISAGALNFFICVRRNQGAVETLVFRCSFLSPVSNLPGFGLKAVSLFVLKISMQTLSIKARKLGC